MLMRILVGMLRLREGAIGAGRTGVGIVGLH